MRVNALSHGATDTRDWDGTDAEARLEPTTSYFDYLATAIELGRTPTIHPDTPLSWWVELSVTA